MAAKDHVTFGDGFADITLSRPFKIDGTAVSALRMREPTVRDNRMASKGQGDDADREVTLFANLCSILPDQLNDLPQRDYNRVAAAYVGFID